MVNYNKDLTIKHRILHPKRENCGPHWNICASDRKSPAQGSTFLLGLGVSCFEVRARKLIISIQHVLPSPKESLHVSSFGTWNLFFCPFLTDRQNLFNGTRKFQYIVFFKWKQYLAIKKNLLSKADLYTNFFLFF